VLSADTQAPVVTETTVGADLLQALEIFAQLRVDVVGKDLAVLAVDDVALPVEEPGRDLVLGRVLDDGDDTLELFGRKLTGAVRGERMSAFCCPHLKKCQCHPAHIRFSTSPSISDPFENDPFA
jgi:hypothetical protein